MRAESLSLPSRSYAVISSRVKFINQISEFQPTPLQSDSLSRHRTSGEMDVQVHLRPSSDAYRGPPTSSPRPLHHTDVPKLRRSRGKPAAARLSRFFTVMGFPRQQNQSSQRRIKKHLAPMIYYVSLHCQYHLGSLQKFEKSLKQSLPRKDSVGLLSLCST